MSFWFEFDAAHKILVGRFSGRLTDEAALEYYAAVREHSIATDARAGIFDMSHVTEIGVSMDFIRKLAHQPPAMPDTLHRPSFLIVPSLVGSGLARIFQVAGSHTRPKLKIATTTEEALETLGVSSPHFEPLH